MYNESLEDNTFGSTFGGLLVMAEGMGSTPAAHALPTAAIREAGDGEGGLRRPPAGARSVRSWVFFKSMSRCVGSMHSNCYAKTGLENCLCQALTYNPVLGSCLWLSLQNNLGNGSVSCGDGALATSSGTLPSKWTITLDLMVGSAPLKAVILQVLHMSKDRLHI